MKPIICITMGDPAGIGSEIISKALHNRETYSKCSPLVIGDRSAMLEAIKFSNLDLKVNSVEAVADAGFKPGVIDVCDLNNVDVSSLKYGKVNEACGRAAGQYIEKAIELALKKEVDAIVTAPIHKESFDLAGYGKKYRGHTEMLAALTGTKHYAMLLAHDNLRVIHVTTHVPLRKAVYLIKADRVYETIKIAFDACQQLGISSPKIAVAGLNPHSGDGGIMGDEEIKEIIPAIQRAKSEGLLVEGPIPPDTIFPKGKSGTYDIIVAMYHDQGHIPLKFYGFDWDGEKWKSVGGVNITMGLPIIRTSVDHGTAFGKAGKGLADEKSLLDAIDYAILIAKNRKLKNANF
ncbi:MAG: 4-hydroxythreonine-4-phosphate dehydrogenase [Candidatus Saganbacteria bacterium]|uniref:4-hydroxythreonine-4-phosphate dehydrogenase n=1 Tax=Candidatus Saganbacteria bacterium TaxID=2575572 RepID=A0A833L2N9_UNCSA|nr:MAG: 4-hydroxythreonine-4-phosphate dehydrogenase [Candidatus Saganbacteria bacterium]